MEPAGPAEDPGLAPGQLVVEPVAVHDGSPAHDLVTARGANQVALIGERAQQG